MAVSGTEIAYMGPPGRVIVIGQSISALESVDLAKTAVSGSEFCLQKFSVSETLVGKRF